MQDRSLRAGLVLHEWELLGVGISWTSCCRCMADADVMELVRSSPSGMKIQQGQVSLHGDGEESCWAREEAKKLSGCGVCAS